MTNEQKRNIWGSVICFLLCAVAGCFGLAFMVVREVKQSDKGGFPVEKDDLMRYSFFACIGYMVNVVLIIALF